LIKALAVDVTEPESSDCCSLKVAGSQPEARWDDMFVYALLAV